MATFTCWLVRSNVLWQRLFFKRRTVFAHHTASTEEKRECHPVNLFWTRQMKTGVRNPVEQRLIHDISGLASWPSTLCSGLMAPYMFIENLSPSNIFDVVENSAFRSRTFGRGRKTKKREIVACVHASSTRAFLTWIILKAASDPLIGFGKWRMETVPFSFGWVSFPQPSCLRTCP